MASSTPIHTTVRAAGDAVAATDAIFVSPETAAAILGISRSAIYDLLKGPKPELDSVRHGKRRLVTRASVVRWAQARLREAGIVAELEPSVAGSEPLLMSIDRTPVKS
ncbi:MAG: helix-turn-helix domain-containing protein [Dehalococcoidia bacterium]|nr:helix-turn-helix domain-containing protein [Dehalococcoidia bacterium]